MTSLRSWISWLLPTRPARPEKETPPDTGGRSLRLRLLLTVIIALTPAAVVNVVQGIDRVQQDVAGVNERLIQTARTTASDAENILASAEQILRALANQPEVRAGNQDCTASLTNALKGLSYFANLGRIDPAGTVLCQSGVPLPGQGDVSEQPWWNNVTRRNGFFVTSQIYSLASGRNVLMGLLPLLGANGSFDGAMAVAMDVGWLDFMLKAKQMPMGSVAAVFDASGSMIASNDANLAGMIFRNVREPPNGASGLLEAPGPKGERWSYALASLRGNDLFVGFAMPNSALFTGTFLRVATDLLLPVLMLGLASVSIWIATNRLVLQWILYLRRIATAYARGHYAIRPVVLEEAPSEFRMLGETFSAMAAAVQDRDRRLREALAQKTLLIRETHHRVKNNLQIVMSLLSLQAGQLRDPAAKDALRQAQVRVNALALVHRILHEIENLEVVDLKRLLLDLVQQIHEGFGAQRRDLHLETDVVSRQVSSDLAVPLTLFTVEVLTNAFKHAFPAGRKGGTIRMTLEPIPDGKLRMAIEDDGVGMDEQSEHRSVGSRLIRAFAQQIGGTVTMARRPAGGTIVTLIFPDPEPARSMADAESI